MQAYFYRVWNLFCHFIAMHVSSKQKLAELELHNDTKGHHSKLRGHVKSTTHSFLELSLHIKGMQAMKSRTINKAISIHIDIEARLRGEVAGCMLVGA